MKRIFYIILVAVLLGTMIACTEQKDTLTFVRNEAVPANMERADYSIQIGNAVGGAAVTAELWMDGECITSAPVIINSETKALHVLCRIDSSDAESETRGMQVQLDTDEKAGSLITYFDLPATVRGYSFTAYENGEVLEVSTDKDSILAALAFDIGSGVRSFDCKSDADDPDRVKSESCVVLIRASFTEEHLVPQDSAQAAGTTAE